MTSADEPGSQTNTATGTNVDRIVQAIQHQRRRARENQFYGLEFSRLLDRLQLVESDALLTDCRPVDELMRENFHFNMPRCRDLEDMELIELPVVDRGDNESCGADEYRREAELPYRYSTDPGSNRVAIENL